MSTALTGNFSGVSRNNYDSTQGLARTRIHVMPGTSGADTEETGHCDLAWEKI